MLKKFELGFDKIDKIINYCKKKQINFLATPFDSESVDFLLKENKNTLRFHLGI